ncbi:MAG: nitroreductase family protein [Clostridium sp.]|nr:nitroreductase family protein [Clostridium sp.]
MILKELITKNRSFRGYNEARQVSREELLDMVDCARLSASSQNIQPLKYYLAYQKEKVEEILSCTTWAKGLPELHLPFPGTHPTAFIVILLDLTIDEAMARFQTDAGIAAQSILLSAAEKGLGGLIIKNFRPAELVKAMGTEETLRPMMVIAIGEPAETVVLEELPPGQSTVYYRTSDGAHHVPKRRLEDIVVD